MKTKIIGIILSTLLIGGLPKLSLSQDMDRLSILAAELDTLALEIPALNEETNISFSNVPLAAYIRAIGLEHQINLYIGDTPGLLITSNLSQEAVKNVFLFVCKNFNYTIEVVGTIIEFKPYDPNAEPKATPPYNPKVSFEKGMLSVDLKNDSLYHVVKLVSSLSGKKILLPAGLEGYITAFLPPTPLDTALEAIFRTNGYLIRNRNKGYSVIEPIGGFKEEGTLGKSKNPLGNNFFIELFTDGEEDFINIEAKDADLALIMDVLFERLGTSYLVYDPLDGQVTAHADLTTLDDWLKIALQGTPYAYKKDDGIYLIGKAEHSWLQTMEMVKLRHRPTGQALELIPGISNIKSSSTPSRELSSTRARVNNNAINNGRNNNLNGNFGNNSLNSLPGLNGNQPMLSQSTPPSITKAKIGEVDLVDYSEMNRIILKGPADQVREIKEFLLEIDRPIPMIEIEMMVVEINQDRFLSTSLKAGLRQAGDSTANIVNILPGLDYTLNGEDINQLLGNVPALAPLGVLSQNFYVNLQAQESRGNLKIQMKPVLSMLNGREASLTIGQTQYFLLETTTANTGAVNNFQQFTQRFESINANVTLTVKPFVSEDGMVTLDVLPDFTTPVGSFDPDVPPTIATRRFVSTIRVKDGETVVLGGLTENSVGENTQGLPWLSRVPVLKWIFGNVQKTRNRSSLLIYITPKVTYY
ncbi:MAG: type II and III secretion system protein [Bacteroidia bacterium]|nr:type II and III secretion system protein [Bacteroidia bacterium]